MRDFYVLTSWDKMYGKREVVVKEYVPLDSDVRYVGPIKANSKTHAMYKFRGFLRTGVLS